jgi:hypothetical protein
VTGSAWSALATAHSWTPHATYANPVKRLRANWRFNGDGRDARWPSLCDSGNVLRVVDDARTAISYPDTTDQVRSGLAAFEAVRTAQ